MVVPYCLTLYHIVLVVAGLFGRQPQTLKINDAVIASRRAAAGSIQERFAHAAEFTQVCGNRDEQAPHAALSPEQLDLTSATFSKKRQYCLETDSQEKRLSAISCLAQIWASPHKFIALTIPSATAR